MVTISLCMIVKNEEAVLARCLTAVEDTVDEIIIVDTGSTDKTKEIAKKFTNNIFDFKWIDDFSAARNFAFSKASMDYQMWLDADDVVSCESRQKIIQLKKVLNPEIDIITMKYNTHFDEFGKPILTSTRERLFKTANNYQWQDPIHEYITLQDNLLHTNIIIDHRKIGVNGDRNLKIYEKMITSGKVLSPRQTYYYARELMDHGKYKDATRYYTQFLDDGGGWYEDNIATCFNLSRCYIKLQEHHKVLPILFKSFVYDTPRAEICCQIAYTYKRIQAYKKAIFWFELALTLEKNSHGFILNDYWDYIPSIELCDCYYKIGNTEKSYDYHLLSQKIKPYEKSVKYNEKFFKTLGYEKKS